MSMWLKDRPTIHRYIDGGYAWTMCPEHGPDVSVDEDGRCMGCGAAASFYGDEPDRPSPVLDLEEVLEALREVVVYADACRELLVAVGGPPVPEGGARPIDRARALLTVEPSPVAGEEGGESDGK